MAGTDAPEMQVEDAVAVLLEPIGDLLRQRRVWAHVEQHGASRAHQTEGPDSDHGRPQEADRGIEPEPIERARRE